MSRLLIIGAGGHGRVVADAALSTRAWERIAFADDRGEEMGSPLGLHIVGTCAELPNLVMDYPAAVVAGWVEGLLGSGSDTATVIGLVLVVLAIPLAIGVAVMRYRLYEVESSSTLVATALLIIVTLPIAIFIS